MNLSDTPFAEKKFMTVNGQRMAYIDEGEGDAIVFSHGNPTSSYLWRNIMPACRGLGRLIACDLIGHGDSDKLPSPNQVAFCRTFSNQEEMQVEGIHYLPEEAPEVVAPAVAAFVRRLRGIA
jgi:hypothetical protein